MNSALCEFRKGIFRKVIDFVIPKLLVAMNHKLPLYSVCKYNKMKATGSKFIGKMFADDDLKLPLDS